MKRWLLSFSILMVGAIFLIGGMSTTSRSMGYRYPIAVKIPAGVAAEEVGYVCSFSREQLEWAISNNQHLDIDYQIVPGLDFEAQVRGHRNTRWYGLVDNAGRESVILVRVRTEAGDILYGLADLPDKETRVVVLVSE